MVARFCGETNRTFSTPMKLRPWARRLARVRFEGMHLAVQYLLVAFLAMLPGAVYLAALAFSAAALPLAQRYRKTSWEVVAG